MRCCQRLAVCISGGASAKRRSCTPQGDRNKGQCTGLTRQCWHAAGTPNQVRMRRPCTLSSAHHGLHGTELYRTVRYKWCSLLKDKSAFFCIMNARGTVHYSSALHCIQYCWYTLLRDSSAGAVHTLASPRTSSSRNCPADVTWPMCHACRTGVTRKWGTSKRQLYCIASHSPEQYCTVFCCTVLYCRRTSRMRHPSACSKCVINQCPAVIAGEG